MLVTPGGNPGPEADRPAGGWTMTAISAPAALAEQPPALWHSGAGFTPAILFLLSTALATNVLLGPLGLGLIQWWV